MMLELFFVAAVFGLREKALKGGKGAVSKEESDALTSIWIAIGSPCYPMTAPWCSK